MYTFQYRAPNTEKGAASSERSRQILTECETVLHKSVGKITKVKFKIIALCCNYSLMLEPREEDKVSD